MRKRLLPVVVLGLLAAGALLWYRFSQIERAEAGAREEVRALLRELPSYGANAPYVDGLLDWAHPEAFAASFERRHVVGGIVHVTDYQQRIAAAMLRRARSDGQRAVATDLELLGLRQGWAVPETGG